VGVGCSSAHPSGRLLLSAILTLVKARTTLLTLPFPLVLGLHAHVVVSAGPSRVATLLPI
jgi:hypothetical protein